MGAPIIRFNPCKKKPECIKCGTSRTHIITQYTWLEKKYGLLCLRCLNNVKRARCTQCGSTEVMYATGKNAETTWMCSRCHKEIESPECVYFLLFVLRGFRAVKIGKSEKKEGVMNRVKSIQTSSPVKLVLLGYTLGCEYKLHKRFHKHRINGEWFAYDPIENEIEQILNSEKGEKIISGDITSPKM